MRVAEINTAGKLMQWCSIYNVACKTYLVVQYLLSFKKYFLLKSIGVPKYQDTLSTLGGPCHFDHTLLGYDSAYDCAICVPSMIKISLN